MFFLMVEVKSLDVVEFCCLRAAFGASAVGRKPLRTALFHSGSTFFRVSLAMGFEEDRIFSWHEMMMDMSPRLVKHSPIPAGGLSRRSPGYVKPLLHRSWFFGIFRRTDVGLFLSGWLWW